MRIALLLLSLVLQLALLSQQWNWASDAGGGGNTDFCYGIATDSQGNAYWCGSVSGTAEFGCATLSPGNTIAGFVAKVDANGACQWVQGITVGFNEAWAYGIAIDAQDRIYITGSYDGNATFGNGVMLSSMGSDDIFLARYNTAGDCLWARRAGSSGSSDEARSVAVSDDGGVFITGFSGGSTITFDNISVPNAGNARQLVVARYDSSGTVQWAKASAGSGQGKSARAISVANDRLFLTGQLGFTAATFDGMTLTPNANSVNIYVLACDLNGDALWANSYSGGDHEGMGIAADTLGNLFVVGRMWGSLYLPDDTLTSVSSNDDILLMGLDRDGGFHWAKSAGSAQRDLAWDVTTDGVGNAYVAAQFNNTIDFFGTPLTSLGSEDILISKVEADGDVVWAQRPSGFQRDIPLCIHRQAVVPNKLYFGGYFWGAITYGSTTIDDVLNGDAMIVSGIDTTFDVSSIATAVCPGACDGAIGTFPVGMAPFTFNWNNGSTAPGLDGLCSDMYIVEVTDANGQVTIDTVYVNEVSDPGYVVHVLNDSLWITGGSSWQWFYNGTIPIGGDSTSHVAELTGNYHAVVSDANGCAWSSDTALVVLNVGVEERTSAGLSIWPNPAGNEVHLRTDGRIMTATGMDVAGKLFPLRTIGPSTISVNELASGIWILDLRMDDGSRLFVRFAKL